MPIEIRELVIKATVDSQGGGGGVPDNANDSGGQDQIIKMCVEKVMQIIQSKSDR